MIFELAETYSDTAVIRVIGLGGAGGNAVENMLSANIQGVEFICANTDAQALNRSSASTKIQLGAKETRGRGAGARPDVGRKACMEDKERLRELLTGTEMLFITAGMGGGTGTGGAPVIAELAHEMEILTVAVVTKPFPFEGKKRMDAAQEGIEALREHVDSIITIPNERLLTVLGQDASILSAFSEADGVLRRAVQGIAELITREGLINVDFADVKTVMSEKGMAMMGAGAASGEARARAAAEGAIRSPLLEDVNLAGARGILVNVTAGPDLNMGEFAEVGEAVREIAAEDAVIVMGAVIDAELADEMWVTVVATGLENRTRESAGPRLAVDNVSAAHKRGYAHYDRPTYMRASAAATAFDEAAATDMEVEADEKLLDIPAFLRRQAD